MDTRAVKKMVMQKIGLKNSEISITGDYSSMSVHLKKFIPITPIKNLVSEFEEIRYDHACGEILSGGNYFVFVSYHRDLFIPEEMKAKIFDIVSSVSFKSGMDEIPNNAKLHLLNESRESCVFRYIWKKIADNIGEGWTGEDIGAAVHSDYEFFKTLTINN